jgi:CRISPR-associated protein Csm2
MPYNQNYQSQSAKSWTRLPEDLATASAELINKVADEQGADFAKKIKTNQLRNVFSEITLIRTKFKQNKSWNEDIEKSLILLKPKLAYAKGRNKEVEPFQKFMFNSIDSVIRSKDKNKALSNFFDLVESIVAYHKFHGGKES